ncbi:hypothetical protein KO528_14645 [Saccharophagus degradans]|uniref:Uncharacterized protein n=1 Tax=Saccharophagus degradans TaxID=86304 RepID=A0AAW7X7V4_9GAMM|nr:hypothetical protein [Saccharophagus degradans]MBU2986599.1 hypothetical protein [Saccharophagus degradans]MDO6422578.1 hypothetical protein [Saccharophagus degradans]MDO6609114.1 hypothetical protein [Saccharophagus degradans]WGO98645.1 hypothetical protein QFX18_01040 [Saccharophagus degradans]
MTEDHTTTCDDVTNGLEDTPELCNPTLRADVGHAIRDALDQPNRKLSEQELTNVAAYINQLEDAVLRIHLGLLKESEVLSHLKKCTGLDIESRAYTFATMYAEDA